MKPFPLQTERLLLREYRPEDEAALHAYASDREVTRHTAWGPNDITTTRAALNAWIEAQEKWPRESIPLAVELRETGQVIGGTGFSSVDFDTLTGVFGYVLHKDHWHKGYGTEMVLALLGFGFDTLALHRIVAECFPEATSSLNILNKVGLRQEAHHRQAARKWGEWRDTYTYAILCEEWKQKAVTAS